MPTFKSLFRGAPALAMAAMLLGAPGARAAGDALVESTSDLVRVEDLHATDAMVTGTLVNQTESRLESVELVISDSFLWKDSWHPGTDDPGNATTSVVAGPIPPRGRVPFRLDRTLPPRHDGAFTTRVDVTGLTMFETPSPRSDAR